MTCTTIQSRGLTPSSRSNRSACLRPLWIGLALLLWSGTVAAFAQNAPPVILDAKTACVVNSPYPMIDATIENSPEVARLYFRSGMGEDFFYVDMTGELRYQGVLLVPAPGTDSIVYYVEAINGAGDVRSLEYTAKVADENVCERALIYQGANPGIVVHSTAEGAAAIPQGFLNTGVASSVNIAGIATPVAGGAVGATAGGLGAGAITGLAAAGVGGVVVLADELDDEGEAPTSPGNP